jgi:uncharacterized membrane protein HdeD (DUF308 family)
MTVANQDQENLALEMRKTIRGHWALFLIQGLIMVALGLFAVAERMVATFAVATFAAISLRRAL